MSDIISPETQSDRRQKILPIQTPTKKLTYDEAVSE